MEPNDQLRRRPVFLDAYGLQSQPGPERYAELEAAYRRALEVVLSGRYASGDRNVAENVARHVIEIWKEEPSCNFLKLTNLAVHYYEVDRARAQLFEISSRMTSKR